MKAIPIFGRRAMNQSRLPLSMQFNHIGDMPLAKMDG